MARSHDSGTPRTEAKRCIRSGRALNRRIRTSTAGSDTPHAIEQGVDRNVFSTPEEAKNLLQAMHKLITKNKSFPEGSLLDTAHADRVLVPIGDLGMAVYQVSRKQVAKIRTILNAKFGPGF